MLDCAFFCQLLRDKGVSFFTGVPDSLLKSFCAFLSDHIESSEHVIAANEGGAIGLAVGHYLATGRPALVYMQNSGQGNAINPLLSICDPQVCGIPMLLLVGWRGEPGTKDEPQHVKQGQVTTSLFDAMHVPYDILSSEPELAAAQVEVMFRKSLEGSCPVALVVKKGIFSKYEALGGEGADLLVREHVVELLLHSLPSEAIVVATTGHISREVYACRKRAGQSHDRDFLMVGGMGHASQVALGLALAQHDRPVFCFDGDGASIMHMGGMALVGQSGCRNLKHIVFNNGAHGSVGGQPTLGFQVKLDHIALGCGYVQVRSVDTAEELASAGKELASCPGPAFLEIRVSVAARADLERPAPRPLENKKSVMEFLNAD